MADVTGFDGREWKGLVKDRAPDQLDVGESQDCSNVFLYDSKLGVIGPSKGRKYQNATQYSDTVQAQAVYLQGNNNRTVFTFRNDDTLPASRAKNIPSKG